MRGQSLYDWCMEHKREDLLEEWDYSKNGELTPQNTARASNKKVHWRHFHAASQRWHEWEAAVYMRTGTSACGCAVCAGKQVVRGINDLLTTHPDVAKEWDCENTGIAPDGVTAGCNKKVLWKCSKCGYRWTAPINRRTCSGAGCPQCSRVRTVRSRTQPQAGVNDLATIHPSLTEEWNYERNGELTPQGIKARSGKKVWWKCKICGHEWSASVHNRSRGWGCPACAKRSKTSFAEQAIFFYIKKLFPDAINGDRHLGKELDIYIPSVKIGIEYDGQYWHQDVRRDEEKNRMCRAQGIELFRVRELGCWGWNDMPLQQVSAVARDNNELTATIERLLELIEEYLERNLLGCKWSVFHNHDIDVERDKYEIQKQYYGVLQSRSIAAKFPAIAKEWDYEKNGDLTPDKIFAYAKDKYWWRCKKGHVSYQASPLHRSGGTGCPLCGHDRTSRAKFKRVINIDTEEVFESAKAACDKYGISPANLSSCCHGKRKVAGGFHWKFIDDDGLSN